MSALYLPSIPNNAQRVRERLWLDFIILDEIATRARSGNHIF
jgi:hypothetical protein